MKRHGFAAAALLIPLLLLISVQVFEMRAAGAAPSLSFQGTTAQCFGACNGGKSTDAIDATLTLYQGTARLDSWSDSGEGNMSVYGEYPVQGGETYELVLTYSINGVEKPPVTVTNTCAYPLPQVSVEIITEDHYLQALERNALTPIKNTNPHVACPADASRFCKIKIKDCGYSEDWPVDLDVYFALGEDGVYLADSCFCIAGMPDLKQYVTVFAVIDNSSPINSPIRENIYFTINVDGVAVYDASGALHESIPFTYHAFGCVDLDTLETLQFNSKLNGDDKLVIVSQPA